MSGLITEIVGAIAPLRGMLSAIAIPLAIAALCTPGQAQVQPITQEPGTNTNVNPDAGNPNQFNITGGQLSGTGSEQNLFHSFKDFGLNSGQTANFIQPDLLPNESIRNILGRVMGGNPSVINGVIQISSGAGTPNLYLMNPAGIIFGANASLNVPASFTATTATGIGFGNNWFNASGINNYAELVGTPNQFAFSTAQPGAIINTANLDNQNGDLMLLGGTVASTGQLNAKPSKGIYAPVPGGQITVAAIPGTSFVRITQNGQLLSLEVQPLATASTMPANWTLPIQSLPELLTGGSGGNATELKVNSQGQVELTGSNVLVENGDVVVNKIGRADDSSIRNGGSVTMSAPGKIITGNITTRGGSVALSATGNIKTENIYTGGTDDAGTSSVKLTSTNGNVVVNTISTGGRGIDISASGVFQAIGSFGINGYDAYPSNPQLRAFLDSKGIKYNLDDSSGPIQIKFANDFPISITAKPAHDGGHVPIRIRYGDASNTIINNTFPVGAGTGSILVQGGNASFYGGPKISGSLIPNNEPFVIRKGNSYEPVTSANYRGSLMPNALYEPLVFPSQTFPTDASGTVGAIVVGFGRNGSLYGSTQNLAFKPVPVPSTSTSPTNPINPGTPTNPVFVPDPITPTNPVIVTDPITPTNPVIATNSPSSDTSNSTTTQTNNPPTELDKKTQSDTSTTSSSVIGYRGNILDVSQDSVSTSCHATELRVRSDGKIELVGSCLGREEEQSKKLSKVNLFEENFMNVFFPELQLMPLQLVEKHPEKSLTIRSQSSDYIGITNNLLERTFLGVEN